MASHDRLRYGLSVRQMMMMIVLEGKFDTAKNKESSSGRSIIRLNPQLWNIDIIPSEESKKAHQDVAHPISHTQVFSFLYS